MSHKDSSGGREGPPHQPLKGLRVLDLSRVLAGPLATMQLGDLGADVIKVERTGAGDETRGYGPPFDQRGEAAYFLAINRNKLGMTADFDSAADVAFIRELAATADVVVDNFMHGALTKRGLDADAILKEHPRLIWCTIGGFAKEPGRPGYDYVAQAESGWMSITGEPDSDPMKVGVALADILTGKETVAAILAAVAGVRGGVPVERRIRVHLFESAVGALINVAQGALVSGNAPRRWGNAHSNLVPYQLFHSSDKPIVIAVGNDAQFASFARLLGVAALGESRFATNAGRVTHRDDIVALITARIAQRRAEEWLTDFRAAGVPAGLVNTVPEVLAKLDASPVTGIPPQAPASVRRPPPLLGEHDELVRTHGWAAFQRM
jgi:crotonobetainyl-CoA:carnitine CoA-transferase CaiB-like acyl-CoA transferase